MSADHILKIFKESVVKNMGPTMVITFNRSKNAFRVLCRIYKNSSVKLQKPPVVYFVSKDGEDEDYEEEAADVGGPLKEFLSIAVETVCLLVMSLKFLKAVRTTKYLSTHNSLC